jgi:rod shape determining protein RodA
VTEKLWRVSWSLLFLVVVIAGIGIAALYSVAGGSFSPWAERHALRLLAGLALVLAMSVVPLRVWMGLAYPVYLLALAALALVLIAGTDAMGARRWVRMGELSLQPSEVMKVALVAALARYYQWLAPEKVSRPLWFALPLVAIAAPVGLVLKQPDLGTAVLFTVVGLGLMFLAGVNVFYFVAGGGLAAGLAPLIFANLHDYQRRRILTFLDPERDPLGAGYHITQSKIALGSGGLAGKGYMQGTQSQLDFLPEKQTDFIFTMFAEEAGFIGALLLMGLYVLLILLLFALALAARNQFARLLVAGPAIAIFIYAFVNMSMVTGLLPVVGVPLPLVSYGGSAMLTIMAGLGLAMSGIVHKNELIRREDLPALG